MKVADRAVDGHTSLIPPGIAQMTITRDESAHAGDRQASFPALILDFSDRCQLRIDQYCKRHRFGFRIARVQFEPEDDDAEAHPDLRRSEPRATEGPHGIAHIAEQIFEFGGAKLAYRGRDCQKPRIAHSENFAYCHGS